VAESPIKGRLLVASPLLGDPNFRRTVVLMLEHTSEGALGVVLNRPSESAVAQALPDWDALAAPPAAVFVGGPVEQGRVIALGRAVREAPQDDWTAVLGRVGMVDLQATPTDVASGFDLLRFFSGYAGWGAGQLEGELREGAWLVLDAREADPLTPDPDRLWRGVLARQTDDRKWLAFFPPDPRRN